jgi:hypothetical protein
MNITDTNIHRYVNEYFSVSRSRKLLNFLTQRPPIENWDVSNVTDMSELFKGRTTFNVKLNWNVSDQ